MNKFSIYSFYRFVNVENKVNIKKVFDLYFKKKLIRGTILIADEGINGSIASDKKSLNETLEFIKKQLKIRKINLPSNFIGLHIRTTDRSLNVNNHIILMLERGIKRFY